jgi:uncharacterized membrane protein
MAQLRQRARGIEVTPSNPEFVFPLPKSKILPMALWPRIYSFLGFKKSYNATLFCIFAPFLLLFTLERLKCLSVEGVWAKQISPGEWYWYHKGRERIGISVHLGAILPCGALTVLQFVPAIRQRMPTFHRINGRIILMLLLVANVGALMIARHAFGGTIETQTGTGFLVIITTIGGALAWYNIKRLQLDQHRAWMLRTMFYMGSIITMRMILVSGALIISQIDEYRNIWSCEQIEWTWNFLQAGDYLQSYPQCANQSGLSTGYVPVLANIANVKDPAQLGTSLQIPFGMAIWLAIIVHVIGVEIYLHLTPREALRLRIESYKRQKGAGYENPGSASLVPEKFGDADPWVVPGRWDGDDD